MLTNLLLYRDYIDVTNKTVPIFNYYALILDNGILVRMVGTVFQFDNTVIPLMGSVKIQKKDINIVLYYY